MAIDSRWALSFFQNAKSQFLLTVAIALTVLSLACGQQLRWSDNSGDLPDMVVHAGRMFSLDLSTHPVYGDPTRSVQIKTVSNVQKSPALPHWLHFNESTRFLTGLAVAPNDLGSFLLSVTSSSISRRASHQLNQVEDVTNDVFQVTVTKPNWSKSSVSHPSLNSVSSNTDHYRSYVGVVEISQHDSNYASGRTGYRSTVEENTQPLTTRPHTSKFEQFKQEGGCEEQIVASLIVCAPASTLSFPERIDLITRLAHFLGIPISSVSLAPSDTRSLVAVTEGGYQLVSAGPGSDAGTGCSLSENTEIIWPLSCSTARHLADFSRVLQHNVDVGRLQEELGGRQFLGWYVASSDSLATRQNRKRHRRAAGTGYRTATPTPAVQPVRPTRFHTASSRSITPSSPIDEPTPAATSIPSTSRLSTPVKQDTLPPRSHSTPQTKTLLASSTTTLPRSITIATSVLTIPTSSSATPPLQLSSSVLPSFAQDKLTSSEMISEKSLDDVEHFSSPTGLPPSSDHVSPTSVLIPKSSEVLSRVLGTEFDPSPLSSQDFTMSRPTALLFDSESLPMYEILTTAGEGLMTRSKAYVPTDLSSEAAKFVDTSVYRMPVSRSAEISNDYVVSSIGGKSTLRSAPTILSLAESTPIHTSLFSFSDESLETDSKDTKLTFVESSMVRSLVQEPTVLVSDLSTTSHLSASDDHLYSSDLWTPSFVSSRVVIVELPTKTALVDQITPALSTRTITSNVYSDTSTFHITPSFPRDFSKDTSSDIPSEESSVIFTTSDGFTDGTISSIQLAPTTMFRDSPSFSSSIQYQRDFSQVLDSSLEFSIAATVSSVLKTTTTKLSIYPTPVSKLISNATSMIKSNAALLHSTVPISKHLDSPSLTQFKSIPFVTYSHGLTVTSSTPESRVLSSTVFTGSTTPSLSLKSSFVATSASAHSSNHTTNLRLETQSLPPIPSKPTAPSSVMSTFDPTTIISSSAPASAKETTLSSTIAPPFQSDKDTSVATLGATTQTDMLTPTPAVPTSSFETATPNTTFTTSTATTSTTSTTTTSTTTTTTSTRPTTTTTATTELITEEDITEDWWSSLDTTEYPYEHINHRPFLERPIGLIRAEQGTLLEYIIPPNVFYDLEDGDTRQLSLALELPSRQDLPDNFWLYLEPRLQMLVGLPLYQDMDIQNSSIVLVARDSEGMAARHRILLQITAQPRGGQLTHRFTLQFLIDFQHFMRDRRNLTYLVSRISEYFGDGPEARYIEILGVSQGSLLLTWSNSTLTSTSTCPKKAIQGLLRQMVRRDGSVRSSFNRFVGRQLRLVHVQFEYLGACHVPPPTSPPPSTTTEIVLEHIDDGVSIWAHVILPVLIAILVFFLLILVFVLCNRRRRERHRLEVADDVVEKEAISNDRNPIIFPEELDLAYTSNGGDVFSGVSFKPRDPLVLPSDCKGSTSERTGHRGSKSSCGRPDRGNWSPGEGEATRMLRNSDFCGGGSSRNSRASNSNRESAGVSGIQPDVLETVISPSGPDVAAFTTEEGRYGEEGDENAMHVYPSSGGARGGDGPEDVQRRAKRKKRSGGRKREMKDSRKKKREKDKGVTVSASSTLSWDRPEHHYLDDEEMASRSSTLNSVRSGKASGPKAGGSGRSPPPRSPPPYWQSQGDPPPYRLPPTYITSNNITRV